MYTVIGIRRSRAFRVLWALEELGQSYEHVPAAPRSAEALVHNPSGKVPALLVGNEVLTDSVAIITYLADKHGALTHPAGTLARARQDALINAVLEQMDAVLWTAAKHSFILPEDQRVPAVKESLRWEFATSQANVAALMDGDEFAQGGQMTVADILLAHCTAWAMLAKFEVTESRLADHFSRMRKRDAYIRAAARD